MAGPYPAIFALAEHAVDGTLNLSMNSPGTIRFWFAPDWTSAGAGGAGPGAAAYLFEVGTWSGKEVAGWWALSIDAAGNFMGIVALGAGETVTILAAPIIWNIGQWHQVALAWDPQGKTVLYLDGRLVAEGTGVGLAPQTPFSGTRGFCVGSDVRGSRLAQGQFEEFYTFGRVCNAQEVAGDYERLSLRAALGPVTAEEQKARLAIAAMTFAQTESAGGGQTQFATGSAQYGCGLWLEVGLTSNANELLVTVHNTIPGKTYRLWSTENLNTLEWALEQTLPGTAGQDFRVTEVSMQGTSGLRPALYFQATEDSDYIVENSFKGLDILDTQIEVADTMGAIGPDHFVELLNGTIVVYDRSGDMVAGPTPAVSFFELQEGGITYPTGGGVFDPRILYDHQDNRWVACGLDGFGSRDVLLAISNDDQPVPILANWKKYRLQFNRAPELTDFPTLGLDANGIYISVQYFNTRSNAVVAIHKPQLYQDNFQAWTFPTESTAPHLRIIQPPVNSDLPPVGNFVWMIAKGPPDYAEETYQGGPVVYRRLQWTAGVPDWADTQWLEVADATPSYRDYFDLDEGDPQNGAPQAGGPIKIRVDGSQSGGVGSRLCMAVIRDNVLWTCHHVGLDDHDGDYDGDESGTTVDRSAVQ